MKQKTKLYIELGLGLLVGLTALILLAVVLVQNALKEAAQPETTQPTVEITQSPFPANPYGPEDFQVEENGYITCLTGESFHGIDVSEWQGDIDWQQVKASGVEFAIIRVATAAPKRGSWKGTKRPLPISRGRRKPGFP